MERISSFEKRIRDFRKKNDLTLDEVSKITGMPAQTINRYELGQRVPKVDIAVKMAEKLGVNPLWLQGYDVGEGDPTQKEEFIVDIITHLRKDDKFLSLVETLHSFPEERIDAIAIMINAFDK